MVSNLEVTGNDVMASPILSSDSKCCIFSMEGIMMEISLGRAVLSLGPEIRCHVISVVSHMSVTD